MTNPPPVAPVEGQMFTDEQFADALNQMHVASKTLDLRDAVHIQLWLAVRGIQDHAFIGAQIAEAHEKALAVASGELERLRAALQKLHEGLAWDWRGHPVGDLPTLREIARTALQGDAP